jgi:hypothetical protein
MRALKRVGIATAAGTALGLLLTATSAAKLTSADMFGATLVQDSIVNPVGGFSGGSVGCGGGRVLTGGGFWNVTGQAPTFEDADNGYLAGSSPARNGKGWYAEGHHRFPDVSRDLTRYAFCVPGKKLRGAKRVTKTVKASDFKLVKAGARCPRGMRVFTGGAFFHAKGAGPDPALGGASRPSASFPKPNGRSWYAAGQSGYLEAGRLSVFAWCLRKDRFGPIKIEKATFTAPDSANTGAYLDCPGDRAALTGGAYWRRPGKSVAQSKNAGVIGGSSPTSYVSAWYAAGQSYGNDHEFRILIHCLGG